MTMPSRVAGKTDASWVRRCLALPGIVLLALVVSGCTGGQPQQSSGPPSQGVTDGATLEAKPVPLEVSVRKVHGRMSKKAVATLQGLVARPIRAYTETAFLGGEYPRRSFAGAFDSFSASARHLALPDRALLTNSDIGAQTSSITPLAQRAALDVLAPNKVAAGITARLVVRFLAEAKDGGVRRVTVTGRLLLTRAKKGGWQIFGYSLAKSSTPVQKGTS